jgi:site-specific DNA recombinase
LYEKYITKFEVEKQEILNQIENSGVSSSNLAECIDYTLQISTNLHSIWELGDYPVKRKLQEMLFPEGVWYNYENDRFRTQRVNSFFSIIPSLSATNVNEKSGKLIGENQNTALVGPTGLEPVTL